MKLLPAGLLECHIEPHDDSDAPSAYSYDWTALPRGLTDLFVYMGNDEVEAHHLKALPPSITNLYLGADGIDTDLLPLLPPNLKTLNGGFLSRELGPGVGMETAKNLPRSITVLQDVETQAVPFLPPSLTYLSLKSEGSAPLPAPLPRSLKTLEMRGMPKDAINRAFYPPTLTSLKVLYQVEPEFFSAFSPTLSMLYLTVNIDRIDPNSELPLKHLFSLSALTKLRLSFSSILKLTSESSSWLPRSLKQLILGECEMESEWFSSLPSSLTCLNLQVPLVRSDAMKHLERCCSQLRSISLGVSNKSLPEANPTVHCLLNLPPSLRHFSITTKTSRARPKFATNDHLRQLPCRLISLQIPRSEEVTSDCLPSLPKSLTRFVINHQYPRWFIDQHLNKA